MWESTLGQKIRLMSLTLGAILIPIVLAAGITDEPEPTTIIDDPEPVGIRIIYFLHSGEIVPVLDRPGGVVLVRRDGEWYGTWTPLDDPLGSCDSTADCEKKTKEMCEQAGHGGVKKNSAAVKDHGDGSKTCSANCQDNGAVAFVTCQRAAADPETQPMVSIEPWDRWRVERQVSLDSLDREFLSHTPLRREGGITRKGTIRVDLDPDWNTCRRNHPCPSWCDHDPDTSLPPCPCSCTETILWRPAVVQDGNPNVTEEIEATIRVIVAPDPWAGPRRPS